MALPTHQITGSLYSALGQPPVALEVVFQPYGSHEARVDGADVLLGSIRYDHNNLPSPVVLTEGGWRVTVRSTAGGKPQWRPITSTLDVTADVSWGDIVAGATSSPPMTPTLVQQAQEAATEAEAAATTATAAAAELATVEATNDGIMTAVAEDDGSSFNQVLTATFAAIPENGARAVGKGELVLNVHDYGAAGDGTTDDTASIQAAIDAGAGGTIYFPPGDYRVTGIVVSATNTTLRGAGQRLSQITSATGDTLTISGAWQAIEHLGIRSIAGGGHCMVIPPGSSLSQSRFQSFELNQSNAAKNLLRYDGAGASAGGGLFDVHFQDFYFQHILTATVPAVYVYSDDNNVFSANKFTRGRCQDSGTWFFDVGTEYSGGYILGNVWDTINFERCDGGGIRLSSSLAAGLHNIGFYDNGTITKNLIQIGRLSTTGPHTRGTTITNYYRHQGTLNAGVYDIALMSGQTQGSTTIMGLGGPVAAGVKVDLGASSGHSTIVGYDAAAVTISNASGSNTTLISTTQGITTPKLAVTGAVGFNGATPVGKAANPGTASGTDAAVLNAVVTALRNVGIVT